MSIERTAPFVDDAVSTAASDITHTTSSTVWGPGALSGKALKAFGEISLDMIMKLVIRRRLATIKSTFDRQPSMFVTPEVSEEVQQMERDLQELRKEGYSRSIQQTAVALFIDMRTIRHRFGLIRGTWNSNRRVFTAPQSPDEKRQMTEVYDALQEMCRPWYSAGIRKFAASVVHRIAEYEALRIHKEGTNGRIAVASPWKDLENSIKYLNRTGLFLNVFE